MDFARAQRDPTRHMIGIACVILVHVLVIYGLVTGLARKGVERGRVVARLNIDEKGNVMDVKIVESSPPRVFDREVINAVMQWKFPAEGEKFIGEVEVIFTLKD